MALNLIKGRLNHGVKQLVPNIVVKSSSGIYVHSECGKKYYDLSCGIGVTNLGHSHPVITEAVRQAAGNLVHCQQNILLHRPLLNLIDKLANTKMAKNANMDSWFFWNSGAEAVEAAVKLARHATKKANVIVFNLGYHGRTFLTMGMSTSGT
jgi:4-aminobutyrate aminotransferase